MTYDFDRIIERSGTNAAKWDRYPADVLPLWVADMDFAAPDPVLAALRARVEHGIFGYESESKELKETVAQRMEKLYGWQISAEEVVITPGVISGFNAAARATCKPDEGIVIQPPVYPPFLSIHKNTGLIQQLAPLVQVNAEHILHYEIDWKLFKTAFDSGGKKTGMFLLCQPHNPSGQIYKKAELKRMAEVCLEKDVIICSDEIHSELVLGGARHVPMAAIDPDIARRTITLIAPSKTFNVAGLYCAFAIIPDAALREKYQKAVESMTLHVSSLGLTAAQAAFSGKCDDWLDELRKYLTANRNFLVEYVRTKLPGIRTSLPDATYLAWLDCNDLLTSGRINTSPYQFFLKKAKVALSNGKDFGLGGEGFVRLNFGCPRILLVEALERMKAALKRD
ncbi:MAG: pyridoxal phosphate-dependent aminotransferase [Anaerolineales bacterium]|nr:pyridoxal phosphate-dependent aminotransferase [Anaerolineales bacterium]